MSFNHLCNLKQNLLYFSELANLKILYLQGNPMSLTHKYRDIVKQRFQNLRIFDGTPLIEDGESPTKKKKKGQEEPKLIDIKEQLAIDIHFRVL